MTPPAPAPLPLPTESAAHRLDRLIRDEPHSPIVSLARGTLAEHWALAEEVVTLRESLTAAECDRDELRVALTETRGKLEAAAQSRRDTRADYEAIEATAAAIVTAFEDEPHEFMSASLRNAIEEMRDSGRDRWWVSGKWQHKVDWRRRALDAEDAFATITAVAEARGRDLDDARGQRDAAETALRQAQATERRLAAELDDIAMASAANRDALRQAQAERDAALSSETVQAAYDARDEAIGRARVLEREHAAILAKLKVARAREARLVALATKAARADEVARGFGEGEAGEALFDPGADCDAYVAATALIKAVLVLPTDAQVDVYPKPTPTTDAEEADRGPDATPAEETGR